MTRSYALITVCFLTVTCAIGQDQTTADIARSGKRVLDQYLQAAAARDWESAARRGEELAELAVSSPIGPYLATTAYSQQRRLDEAVKWLDEAAQRGFSSVEDVSENEDFEGVRNHSGYGDAISRMVANRQAADMEFARRAAASIPIIFQPEKLDRPAAILIALHGYGGNTEATREGWKSAARASNALLIVPRAVRPAGSGFTWAEANETELLTQNAREHATSQGHSLDAPVIVAGFSEGANMALELVLGASFQSIGAIAFGAEFTSTLARKLDKAQIEPRGIFMAIGSFDPNRSSNIEAQEAFDDQQWPVQVQVIGGLGHNYPEDFPSIAVNAVAFVLSARE